MSDNQANNKRIAKNTLLLYGRMLLMMIISLYTSRVVLNALGVEDYGIYNVVGGVVGMFSILSGSLTAATSRFITFQLGRNDINRLRNVFGTSIYVQFALIIAITVLIETIGLWFLNYKMVIPSNRILAANVVFQISTISFVIGLWSIPYNAAIIAHEKMYAFAYISLLDGFNRLLIAFLLLCSPIDKLIYFSILCCANSVLLRVIYASYCKRHFDECRGKLSLDKSMLKEIFSFAGWNFIGSSAAVLRDQGVNLLLNVFFGPAVNASRGIANSVNAAVLGFASNFMTAVNPQITKSYSAGDYDYLFKLIFQSAKYSYFILLILILPVIFTTPALLDLWLGQIPENTVTFTRLVLIFTLNECLSGPLVTAMLATGNIRNYQIIVGGCQMLNVPICYILLKFGGSANVVYIVGIGISVMAGFLRIIMLRNMIGLSIRNYLYFVYLKVFKVTAFASILPVLFSCFLADSSLISQIGLILLSVLSTAVSVFYMGCSNQERNLVVSYIKKYIAKIRMHK